LDQPLHARAQVQQFIRLVLHPPFEVLDVEFFPFPVQLRGNSVSDQSTFFSDLFRFAHGERGDETGRDGFVDGGATRKKAL
jgi:hypothetical protein